MFLLFVIVLVSVAIVLLMFNFLLVEDFPQGLRRGLGVIEGVADQDVVKDGPGVYRPQLEADCTNIVEGIDLLDEVRVVELLGAPLALE